jgi:hypothetical protein
MQRQRRKKIEGRKNKDAKKTAKGKSTTDEWHIYKGYCIQGGFDIVVKVI